MINNVENGAFKVRLSYQGATLVTLVLDSHFDCRAYALYWQDNIYGSADIEISYHNRVISRFSISNRNIRKERCLNPFPITRDFKRRRIKRQIEILGKYGLTLKYNLKTHKNEVVFIDNEF